MREDKSHDDAAIEALKLGLDLGMSLIDTAEMYAAGHSEELVSRALEGRRSSAFVASKVSPSHFAFDDVTRSARMSLKRLGVEQIDLYQLHWPNPKIPITETMRAMEKLVNDGLIKRIGVSNFSINQMREAQQALSKEQIVSNQVEYSLLERSVEYEIVPYCANQGITVIAYSPLAQGRIPMGLGRSFVALDQVASRVRMSRTQVALSWLLHHDRVVVIPKAVKREHLKENADVGELKLNDEDYETLGRIFG